MHSATICVLLACAYPFFASAFTDEALSARAYLERGRLLQSEGRLVDAERQFDLAISRAERQPNGSDLVWCPISY